MLSVSIGAHKYAACFYWRPPSSYLCAQQQKFRQKYGEAFYWVDGAAARICMKICIACSHVGQMLFAGNKYLLLKRITVQLMSGKDEPDQGSWFAELFIPTLPF